MRSNRTKYDYADWGGLESVFHNLPGTSDDRTVSYAYDDNGNLRSTADSAIDTPASASGTELLEDRLYTFGYDALDRVDTVTAHYIGGEPELDASYDRFGNRETLDLTDGEGTAEHTWSFDASFNRLVEATLPGGGDPTLEFSYLDNDDLETLAHGNDLETTYAYQTNGPVQSITLSGGPLHRLLYTHDNVLNVKTITETIEGTERSPAYDFDYDDLDRLIGAEYPSDLGLPSSESFSYDAASNRDDNPASATPWAYDANNRMTASPFADLSCYDADGNLTSTRESPDTCTSGTDTQTFTWNAQSRLRRYQNPGSSKDVAYLYDTFGRRIRKTDGSTVTDYLWDGDRLLAEYDGSGDRQVRYAYAGGFAPVQVAYANGTGEDVYDVHSDHLDTPKLLTDDTDEMVWRAAHEAFGKAEIDEDPDGDTNEITFNVRFPGQYYDAETERWDPTLNGGAGGVVAGSGLHYNRFRYYDSVIGRYISADPVGQLGGTNLFMYARANPMTFLDPLGLQAAPAPRPTGTGRGFIPRVIEGGAGKAVRSIGPRLGAGVGAGVAIILTPGSPPGDGTLIPGALTNPEDWIGPLTSNPDPDCKCGPLYAAVEGAAHDVQVRYNEMFYDIHGYGGSAHKPHLDAFEAAKGNLMTAIVAAEAAGCRVLEAYWALARLSPPSFTADDLF